MKHTPGPWYAQNCDMQGLVYQEDTGENIAVSYNKKNTQLIGAAPDLLEACKMVQQYLHDELSWFHNNADDFEPQMQTYCDSIDTALAKAEGRE